MRHSLYKRIRRAVKREFRRIRDQHRTVRVKRKKLPLRVRFRHWVRKVRNFRFRMPGAGMPKPYRTPLRKRIKHFIQRQRRLYSLVFTREYLIIAFNSSVLFLSAFFIIHFLTHLFTGFSSWISDISTTLHYTVVDFHIRYWNWTEEKVITVFTIPAVLTLLIALWAAYALAKPQSRQEFVRKLKSLFRRKRRRKKRRHHSNTVAEGTAPVQAPIMANHSKERRKPQKRLSWPARLFILWIMYHSLTYFFSGLLYAFLFHRRFSYVTWYAFNMYLFDVLFSIIAFLSMVIIGYTYAKQFFNSGRMYFNDLTDRNRLPFVVSQALIPFIAGTILTILLQIPEFDPALILLNFSVFFLLLPLPSRALRYDDLHFDREERKVQIYWKWVGWSAVIIIVIVTAIKIGIPINLPAKG